jgi:hypothetical protein
MEADAGDAVKFVSSRESVCDDLKDVHFVLIGAGSAMGPLKVPPPACQCSTTNATRAPL